MGPERNNSKVAAESNVYTVMVTLSFLLMLATVGLVVFKCYYQYETIFQIK